jgi:hypothetical protein
MESTLEAYAEAFESALAGWENLVGTLSADQFNRKPSLRRWSVGQCMDHVNRVSARYLPDLNAALAAGGPPGGPPFRYDMRGRLFIKGTAPVPVVRQKTLREMEPWAGPIDLTAALDGYRRNTAGYLSVLRRARGLDLSRIRMPSPYLPRVPFLTFPVGSLIEGSAGHEHRHLAQARRVVAEMRR